MQYMLMMISKEDFWTELTEEEQTAVVEQHEAFSTSLREQGKLLDSSGLAPVRTAKTLRHDGRGVSKVTDGPYVEAKEVMGGYYKIKAESMEEALEWAAQIPFASSGAVEVRPTMGSD